MGVCVSSGNSIKPTRHAEEATKHGVVEPKPRLAQPDRSSAHRPPLTRSKELSLSNDEGLVTRPADAFSSRAALPGSQERLMAPFGSPCSTSLSGSGEGPFTGYNPAAWFATSNVSGEGENSAQGCSSGKHPPSNAAQRNSMSIRVLERISKERSSRLSISINRGEDYAPSSKDAEADVDSKRKSLSGRTRRLSSQFNGIPTHLEHFLPRQEEETMADYLRRVFAAVDVDGKGIVPVARIVRKVFPEGEQEPMRATLGAASTTTNGDITVGEFVKFFARLGRGNCLGPEFDTDVGGGDDREMGLSQTESAMDETGPLELLSERARAMSVKLMSNGATEVCPMPRDGSCSLRDVRVKFLTSQCERVKCIALSSDPRLYAVSHRHDSVAHIFNNGCEVRQLKGHGDSLLGIAFSPDRKYVATVSRDKLLIVWDCTVGLECHSVEHPGIVTALAFAMDGKHVFTGCQDNLTRKISFPKGRLRATAPELPNAKGGVVVSVSTQHTRNGFVVFSRSCDEHAYVAQGDNLSLCMQLNGHETLVWQTAFSSNDEYILTCCERKLIVWRTADFTPVGDFDASGMRSPRLSGGAGAVAADLEARLWTTAVFGPLLYKNLIFAFNTHGEVLVLDMDRPEEGPVMDLRLRSSVYSASTSDNSNCLVCGDDLGNVYQLTML